MLFVSFPRKCINYYIEYTEELPNIDGLLDDPIWKTIKPITDFIQENSGKNNNILNNSEIKKIIIEFISIFLLLKSILK